MRYIFGDYVLDTQRHELHHAGTPIKLRRKGFQVLVYLLAQRDRVVPKQELLAQLWSGQFVGDEALTSCIKTLRQALGERGRAGRFLRTLHGQGYRLPWTDHSRTWGGPSWRRWTGNTNRLPCSVGPWPRHPRWPCA
jgi:DNA-binding winged helix-turn-helix (wHTH) protein